MTKLHNNLLVNRIVDEEEKWKRNSSKKRQTHIANYQL